MLTSSSINITKNTLLTGEKDCFGQCLGAESVLANAPCKTPCPDSTCSTNSTCCCVRLKCYFVHNGPAAFKPWISLHANTCS